jgi:hypothetical protein
MSILNLGSYEKVSADPRRLSTLLDSSTVQSLLSRAEFLKRIQDALREWFDEPVSSSIKVANLRGGTLTVHVRNAAASTHLRYSQNEALKYLNQRLNLEIYRLVIRVDPSS